MRSPLSDPPAPGVPPTGSSPGATLDGASPPAEQAEVPNARVTAMVQSERQTSAEVGIVTKLDSTMTSFFGFAGLATESGYTPGAGRGRITRMAHWARGAATVAYAVVFSGCAPNEGGSRRGQPIDPDTDAQGADFSARLGVTADTSIASLSDTDVILACALFAEHFKTERDGLGHRASGVRRRRHPAAGSGHRRGLFGVGAALLQFATDAAPDDVLRPRA